MLLLPGRKVTVEKVEPVAPNLFEVKLRIEHLTKNGWDTRSRKASLIQPAETAAAAQAAALAQIEERARHYLDSLVVRA